LKFSLGAPLIIRHKFLPDSPSVYQGAPLSLEDMEKAIDIEAGKHKK